MTTQSAPLDLAGCLARFPWSEDALALGTPLDSLWTFELDVSAAELWPFIMDTSHFNRALGLPKMEYRQLNGALAGSARNGGFLQEWIEDPWLWVARSTLTLTRRYSRGVAHHMRCTYVLQPLDDGRRVRLYIYFGWIPRGVLGRLGLRLGFPRMEAPYRRLLHDIARHIKDTAASKNPYLAPPPELSEASRLKLESLAERLHERARTRGLPARAVDLLVEHLRTGDEMELNRLRIVPLARAWGLEVDALLGVCLHATRLGLLTLSWDVTCPHCRGVVTEGVKLGDVSEKAACAVCQIDFQTDEPTSIEINFHPHASVRDVPQVFYCAAEPAKKAHILVQQRMGAGEQRSLATLLEPGRYRMRIEGENRYRLLDLTDGPATPTAQVGWSSSDEEPVAIVGAHPSFALRNETATAQTFIIERAGWADDALRPVRLFSMQEFRDLFSEEFLSADVQLSIGEQTILFTDMIGSTRFYDLRGDPGAFSQVKWHFSIVYEIVRRHHGAIIKTIGDAVMAAFHDAVDALRASVEIHQAFYAGRPDTLIRLRISMNRGPCIAVNLNSAIDYFGRTVNAAAKLQACVEAGQISFPRVMTAAPGVAAYLEATKAKLEEVVVESSSLSEPILAFRWDVNDRCPGPAPPAIPAPVEIPGGG